MNTANAHREIPFNYTSADDQQAITWLLGPATWDKLEQLRARRVTGRSARLMMRVFGEVLIHRRNAFLYEELVADARRRRRLFRNLSADLALIEANAGNEPLVFAVLADCRTLLDSFRQEIAAVPRQRQRLRATLGAIIGRDNVRFDPFTLVSHATDATDWRLYLPVAVAFPTETAQVASLLAAIAGLGLTAIPRGAGTGLTGGAVPLRANCVLINTEKLNRIRGITDRAVPQADGTVATTAVMDVEAGVITEDAMDTATARGLVFATDPTSAWASTIGGNIAENAGGKTAVLWGTCLDNLLSYELALPTGTPCRVRRIQHPLRKILPTDTVRFVVEDEAGQPLRAIVLNGEEIRRPGLWKDITNKTLRGLPGVQKEGTDGVITSAEFILHRQFPARATVCLEFFGPDFDEASRVILEIVRAFPADGATLQALEHFDDEYVRAIGYKVKAARAETPKAVLLVDLVGAEAGAVGAGVDRLRALLARHANTCLFVAPDEAEAKLFWADRKKLGAIAARTNAFKLNEDICLPLEALAEFSRFCDALNVEEERAAQLQFVARARAALRDAPAPAESPFYAENIASAVALVEQAGNDLRAAGAADLRRLAVVQRLREDWRRLLRGYDAVLAVLDAAHDETRNRRIVIATHMHAGDGNVHVNIPVMSSDRAMMRRAEAAVDRVMEKVGALGGVCSGEHGIGVTKLQYLDRRLVDELTAYRQSVDPGGVMNPGKLADYAATGLIYTPSFNLLELEARILRHGQLEELAVKIAQCVRCGKCKPDCCVFHPARDLFYHPRNKNLAIGALIEALLYDAQRERAASFGMLRHLQDVADHCTICHKCHKPCPVAIDTGVVSVLERALLGAHGHKRTATATQATLRYLESRSPLFNAAFHAGIVKLGGAAQRAAAKLAGPNCPVALLRSPVPPADAVTRRVVLPACPPHQVLVLEPDGPARATVFYFPGCGSERLYGEVALAALHVLLELGARVVLPPPFLCCGFPHQANAHRDAHGRIVLRDTIVFSQIREMFAYLDFAAVIVTCGTCREALGQMEAGAVFRAPVVDLARFAADQGLQIAPNGDCLYHAPCHDSLDGHGLRLLAQLGAGRVQPVPHCCSEAGTLALSRPDITDAMLHRKTAALLAARGEEPAGTVILTNCPSCLQGLGRATGRTGVVPRHLAVELAHRLSGDDWLATLRRRAARTQAIQF